MSIKTILGISIAAIFVITLASVSVIPDVFAKPDANGKPDLVAKLTGFVDEANNGDFVSDAKGKAMFWFDNDSDPSSIRYQIVVNMIDVNDNPGKGLDELLKKVHIHYAPAGEHMGMHLYNILGPADDEDDGKIAGNTLSGVWDEPDVWEDWDSELHHSSKPLNGEIPAEPGKTILELLCTGNTDVNIHTDSGGSGSLRGVIEPNSDACSNLGF